MFDPLARLYGDHTDVPELLDDPLTRVLAGAGARSAELRHLDADHEVHPEWFLDESMIGYVCYADRFSGTLSAIEDRIDYLEEAWVRRHPRFGSLLGLSNFHDDAQSVDADLCRQAILGQPRDVLGMWPVDISDGWIHLQPLSVAWITDG